MPVMNTPAMARPITSPKASPPSLSTIPDMPNVAVVRIGLAILPMNPIITTDAMMIIA